MVWRQALVNKLVTRYFHWHDIRHFSNCMMLPSTPKTNNAHQDAASHSAVEILETPSPPSAGTSKFQGASVTELTNLVQLGVLSKKEVRTILLKRFSITATPQTATTQPATPQTATLQTATTQSATTQPATTQPAKRRRQLTPAEIDETINGALTKRPRPGKASPTTSRLRKLVKDPTRQRFLSQCCDIDSLLWPRREGHLKREINKLLFARAAQDPIAVLYQSYPGALYAVSNPKLLEVMRWQVLPGRMLAQSATNINTHTNFLYFCVHVCHCDVLYKNYSPLISLD